MKRLLLALIFSMMLISLASGLDSLGTIEKCQPIRISQVCEDASYINISSITYPNKTAAVSNIEMSSSGSGEYYYDFTDTCYIGRFDVRGISDGCDKTFATYFISTDTGDEQSDNQGFFVLAQLGILALFLALGFSFSKEKWKMRSLFFMAALFMGVLILNSVRVIAGTSSKLSTMANTGLILGIVLLSFMFIYMLIFYTIEIFRSVKKKKELKWEVGQSYS